jgi:hypothetical protein
MAKSREALTTELEEFLSTYAAEMEDLTLEVRDLVLELAPEAIEQIDLPAKMLAYGFAETYTHTICVIIPHKAYVNLGFPRGTELPDPSDLLEGTGKKARHVKIYDEVMAQSPKLRALLQASVDATPRVEQE